MEFPDCSECQRLWVAYAEAIRNHIRLEYKLKEVALEGNLDQIREIARETDEADQIRRTWRDAIQQHEMTAHRQSATAGK